MHSRRLTSTPLGLWHVSRIIIRLNSIKHCRQVRFFIINISHGFFLSFDSSIYAFDSSEYGPSAERVWTEIFGNGLKGNVGRARRPQRPMHLEYLTLAH